MFSRGSFAIFVLAVLCADPVGAQDSAAVLHVASTASRASDEAGRHEGSAREGSAHEGGAHNNVARARDAFGQARRAYARGDLVVARKQLARARELLPSPELAYDLARVHERMGDAAAASALYREYLELGKPSEREREQVARAMQRLSELQARRQEALKAAPPDASLLGQEARAMFELGVTAYRARRYEAALAAFLAAKSSVALPELDYNLALTCEHLGALRDAIDHYRAYAAHLRELASSRDTSVELERIRERVRAHEAKLAQEALRGPRPPPQAAKHPHPKSAPRPR